MASGPDVPFEKGSACAHLDGGDIRVEFTKDQGKDLPRVAASRDLTPAEEDRLYEYYRLEGGGTGTAGSARPTGPALESERAERVERARLRKHDRRAGDA